MGKTRNQKAKPKENNSHNTSRNATTPSALHNVVLKKGFKKKKVKLPPAKVMNPTGLRKAMATNSANNERPSEVMPRRSPRNKGRESGSGSSEIKPSTVPPSLQPTGQKTSSNGPPVSDRAPFSAYPTRSNQNTAKNMQTKHRFTKSTSQKDDSQLHKPLVAINMLDFNDSNTKHKLVVIREPCVTSISTGDYTVCSIFQKGLICDINGYQLNAQNVSSPPVISTGFGTYNLMLRIQKSSGLNTNIYSLKNLPFGLKIDAAAMESLDAEISSHDMIIILLLSKAPFNQHTAYLEMYSPKLFPSKDEADTRYWPIMRQKTPENSDVGTRSMVRSLFDWENIYESLHLDRNSVVVVCGGKDVGKSSLLRFMINRYVSIVHNGPDSQTNETKNVMAYYLDCDPGQTEFSPPCQVSITKISDPILSPPFISQILYRKNQLLSSSVASVSPGQNPFIFVNVVRDIVSRHKVNAAALNKTGPLFVNTMGWPKDLGYRILIDVLDAVRPTHLIQLSSVTDSRLNFDHSLSPEFLDTQHGLLSRPAPQRLPFNFAFTSFVSNLQSHSLQLRGKSFPAKNRTAAQLAYMSLIPEALFLPSILLYSGVTLPLDGMNFHFASTGSPRDWHSILNVLDLQWVQIVHVNLRSISHRDRRKIFGTESAPQQPGPTMWTLSRVCENVLLGCGIVKCIRLSESGSWLMDLITPEPAEKFDSMNCILKAEGIQTPDLILEEQAHTTPEPKFIPRLI